MGADWLAFANGIKDFGFPAVMSVLLIVLLTKNMDQLKTELHEFQLKMIQEMTSINSKLDQIIRELERRE